MKRILATFVIACLLCACTATLAGTPITTGSLMEEMVDLARLGDFPAPAYKTVQFSSYDHRSVLPGGPDWFANSDGFGNEPVPNFEAVLEEPCETGVGRYLICDAQGPGAIVRTWTAAISGTIRVTLDDSQQPLFDGPAQEFLQQSYRRPAETCGLAPELFVGTFRQRDACYLPIPFAGRCRIEWTGDVKKIHFYEVQIRQYEQDAEVVTFQSQDFNTYKPILERVTDVLSDPQGNWCYRSEQEPIDIDAAVEPAKKVLLASLTGPMAIERLTLKLEADDLDRALRQTVLRIVFDDHPWGQIECPVGDFFGAAPGVNPFNSVPLAVAPSGEMTCRYVMPFARSCQVFLENRGQQNVSASGSILPLRYTWDDQRSMHLRARWRVDHDLVASGGDGAQDLPFLVARGSGVYVGTTSMLLNPNSVPTSYGNWWGEGDEKIFVDDDVHPSTFGTGSEDYYNYSWSSSDIFLYPYCGQPRNDGPANRGFVVNQRWHIIDPLPFKQRLAFYMELFSHETTPGVSYARIAYHYGRPGMMDDHVGITDEDLRPLQLPENWQPAARMGARGSVFFQAEQLLSAAGNTQQQDGRLWAGNKLLSWSPKEIGEEIGFDVPVAETGKYVIHITAAMTPGSGTVSATLDGTKVPFGGPDGTIDLKTGFRVLSRTFSSPPLDLEQGKRQLTLHWIGVGEEQAPSPDATVGIDFIWLQRR